ncbi:hypothetical protein JXB37_00860 [candidate division WOR-3 bacterium]|nr:hypothetical protein [candidate division WOR-3 bacterium]
MKHLILPVALAALVGGCGRPMQVADAVPDTLELYETTRVIREIHEVPVYYVDTVYYEEEPAPAETVFLVDEYESETYVFVSEPGRPHPRRQRPRWSPGLPDPPGRREPGREQEQRGERPDDPDPEPPPRGRREPGPAREPTPPDETVAEETQRREEPGRDFVPVLVVEEELPLKPAPPQEPVVPVAFTPAEPSAPARAERSAPRPAPEVTAPARQSADDGPSAEQPATRGQRPARDQPPPAETDEPEEVAGN